MRTVPMLVRCFCGRSGGGGSRSSMPSNMMQASLCRLHSNNQTSSALFRVRSQNRSFTSLSSEQLVFHQNRQTYDSMASSLCLNMNQNPHPQTMLTLCRFYASEQPYKQNDNESLMDRFQRTIKDEMSKNKELQENRKKLEEEMKRLNNADNLKKAREKYELIGQQTLKSTEQIKKQLDELQQNMYKALEDARKSDYGKKFEETGQKVLNTAKNVQQSAEQLGDVPGVKQVAATMKAVQSEISDAVFSDAHVYSAPETLRLRSETHSKFMSRPMDANTEAQGVQLHSSARWTQSWAAYVAENPVVEKLTDLKTRYDESENLAVRITRSVTDVVGSIISPQTGMSEVLTEISKVDSNFDLQHFKKFLETEMIPNVLEALIRMDEAVLSDWMLEKALKPQLQLHRELRKMDLQNCSQILDISRIDIEAGKMMDQGPVFVIRFHANQIYAWKHMLTGEVKEGNLEVPIRMVYVMAVCRDMETLDPNAAWRVLEMFQQPQ